MKRALSLTLLMTILTLSACAYFGSEAPSTPTPQVSAPPPPPELPPQHLSWVREPLDSAITGDPALDAARAKSYLDISSIHPGHDGLMYFSESENVSQPDDIGKVGLMNDAYDCKKNIKFMCTSTGDWRNDTASRQKFSQHDAGYSFYRRYLCSESPSSHATASKRHAGALP